MLNIYKNIFINYINMPSFLMKKKLQNLLLNESLFNRIIKFSAEPSTAQILKQRILTKILNDIRIYEIEKNKIFFSCLLKKQIFIVKFGCNYEIWRFKLSRINNILPLLEGVLLFGQTQSLTWDNVSLQNLLLANFVTLF